MAGVLDWTVVLVFGVVLSMVGVPFLALGIYRLVAERSALSRAETVTATITRAEVDRYEDVTDEGNVGGRHYLYEPQIAFEYEYGGRTYESDLTSYERRDGAGMSRDRAYRKIEPYVPGETVTAYVDPRSPSRGFLERNEGRGLLLNLFLVGFGGLFALVGFGGGILLGLAIVTW